MSLLGGFINLASNAGDTFTTAADSDLLIYTSSNTQKIIMGPSNPNLTLASTTSYFSNGNVGIGTSTPSYPLHVVGSGVNATPNLAIINTTVSNANTNLFIGKSATLNGYLGYWHLGNDAAPSNLVRLGVFSGPTELQINQNGNSIFGPSGTPIVPGSMLAICSNMSVGSAYATIAAPSNGMIIQSNVGIGTSNPNCLLAVAGGHTVGAAYSNVVPPTNGLLVQGNVGIGTSNPAGTLAVAGGQTIGTAYSNVTPPTNGLLVQGNVGIGTTNPGYPLDIVGNVRFGANVNNYSYSNVLFQSSLGGGSYNPIAQNGDMGFIYFNNQGNSSNGLVLMPWTGSNGSIVTSGLRMANSTIQLNGNIGIGTSNPNCLLAVAGGHTVGAAYSNVVPPTDGLIIQGNTGIGISNPSYPLHIVGSGTGAGPNLAVLNTTLNNTNTNIFIGKSASINAYVGFWHLGSDASTSNLLRLGVFGGGIELQINKSGNSIFGNSGTPVVPGSMLVVSSNMSVGSAYVTTAAPANGMIIQSNVGIGTSNPNCLLAVAGGHTVGAAYSNVIPPTNGMIVQGNMGIGTSNPAFALDVYSASSTNSRFGSNLYVNGGSIAPCIGFNTYYNSGWINGGTGTTIANVIQSYQGNLQFLTFPSATNGNSITPTTAFSLSNNGYVGIGTTTPSSILHISGASNGSNSIYISSPANAIGQIAQIALGIPNGQCGVVQTVTQSGSHTDMNLLVTSNAILKSSLYIQGSTSYVGIGTTTPTNTLDVRGGISASNISATNNITLNNAGNNNNASIFFTNLDKGIAYSGTFAGGSYWSNSFPTDGLVMWGFNDGALGTKNGGSKIALAWNNSGNVGIGTLSPGYTLDVSGSINKQTDVYTQPSSSIAGPFTIRPTLRTSYSLSGNQQNASTVTLSNIGLYGTLNISVLIPAGNRGMGMYMYNCRNGGSIINLISGSNTSIFSAISIANSTLSFTITGTGGNDYQMVLIDQVYTNSSL